jgi:hypothetical protein
MIVTLCDSAVSSSIAEMVEDSLRAWHATDSVLPRLRCLYTRDEQERRENLLDCHLKSIDAELLKASRRNTDAQATMARITSEFVHVTTHALELEDPGIRLLLRDEFSQIGLDLARWARRLDARVSMADIMQAARNAWTACGLQLLLGKRVRLTPAIFAYSMLYPYSDNYLDDKAISRKAKLQFSERFRRRLDGGSVRPRNGREEIIWQLVGLIESQYWRRSFPQVYDSLLAIHGAQQESIRQTQKQRPGEIDVARLTMTKGGTSVLADAYLAAGNLSQAEVRFAFNWGIVLQLGDDLQDFRTDRQRGSLTLFTQAAERKPLDQITNRTLCFSQCVMLQMEALAHGTEVLKELLTKSSRLLVIRSAANTPANYTGAYLKELECYSPLGFEFLRNREQRFERRRRSYGRLFERLARVAPDWEPSNARDYRVCCDVGSGIQVRCSIE